MALHGMGWDVLEGSGVAWECVRWDGFGREGTERCKMRWDGMGQCQMKCHGMVRGCVV